MDLLFFESFPQVSAFAFYLSISYTLGMEVINTYGRMNPERYFLNKEYFDSSLIELLERQTKQIENQKFTIEVYKSRH